MSSPSSGPYISLLGRMRQALLRSRARMLAQVHAQGFTELSDAHNAIWRHGGADGRRPSEIALVNGISKQAVNDLLGQLERWGYLVRVRDPEDGRGRIVRFTERGHAAMLATVEASRAVEAEWRESVGEPAWSTFREVIEQLARWDEPAGAQDDEPGRPARAG